VQTQIFSQNPAKRGIIIGDDEFNAHGMAGAGAAGRNRLGSKACRSAPKNAAAFWRNADMCITSF
jgi:hypothetical protein